MKKLLFMFLAFSTVLLVCSCSGKKVTRFNSEDYCSIKTEGYNGYATVTVSVDDSLINTIPNDILGEGSSSFDEVKLSQILDSIEYRVISDNNGKICNDDVVNIEMIYDEEGARNINLVFEKKNFDYKISGLIDATVIDPFEGLEIDYYGVSPKAYLVFNKINCNEYVNKYLTFISSKTYGISNGDTISVKFDCSDYDNSSNIVFSSTEKDYTVKDLPTYPSSLDNIDVSPLDKKYKEMIDTELIKRNYNKDELHKFRTFVGEGSDLWTVIEMQEPILVNKVYFYAKDINNDIVNNYFQIWELPLKIKKVSSTNLLQFDYEQDSYSIDDEISINNYITTYIQNFAVDSSNQITTDYANDFILNYYVNDLTAESIFNNWEAANIENYQITELD